jgi:hypothetical protein
MISSTHFGLESDLGLLWPTISPLVEENIMSYDPVLCSRCMSYTESGNHGPSVQVEYNYNT